MPTIARSSGRPHRLIGRHRPEEWRFRCIALAGALAVGWAVASARADQPPLPHDSADLTAVTQWLGDYLGSIESGAARAERAVARAELDMELTRLAVARLRGRPDADRVADELFPGAVLLDRPAPGASGDEVTSVTARGGGRSVTVRLGDVQTAQSAARANLVRARNELRQAQRVQQPLGRLIERAGALPDDTDLTPRQVRTRVQRIIQEADTLRVRHNLGHSRPVPDWAEPDRRTLTDGESGRVTDRFRSAVLAARPPDYLGTVVRIDRDQVLPDLGRWEGPAQTIDLVRVDNGDFSTPGIRLSAAIPAGRSIPEGAVISHRGGRWQVTLPADRDRRGP